MTIQDNSKAERNWALSGRSSMAIAFSAILIAGCGGSSSDDDDSHEHTDIDTAGRLALFDTDANAVKVLDIDDNGQTLATFELTGEAPRLFSSPDSRYGVVIQRGDDLVSFFDSGLYTEDHGDHMHDYAETPTMLNLTLNDNRPTHYSLGDDRGIVFFDGSDAASSKVTVFTDESLGGGTAEASLDLDNNMHGVAKLADSKLFVTYRDASVTDTTLPSQVERYDFANGAFAFEERYSETCPRLHGAAANDHVVAFGCSDGVLVIDLHGVSYPATKLGNPDTLEDGSRIGTLASHHNVEEMVGIAGDQLFVIDAEAATDNYSELALEDGVGRIAQGFDAHGEVFYVMGDDGKLRIFHPSDEWALAATLDITPPLAETDAAPAIAQSASEDRLFVLNPNDQTIIEIDTHDGDIVRTITLDFAASGLVWLGLPDHDHDHDHEE
ncbi:MULTISPECIES: hypothetical protein [Marinobacter]|jgi:hypothetical protein|uniref:hypothetical protein n=1 Tax=Marinobacter TaxID=2742 RepID=UPI001E5FDC3D|nr:MULTISPECIES: hypothetical protein [Marinobacter]MCZ4284346.1 hypothetical protein [Marinobacter salarius]MDM8178778.1 hypothetical protein [Marinobacter salarius]MDP4530616.1 hypothetical protein [Marinobacter salarius]|tara:strand:- start:3149 stop:4468 length:1320 start_codon:yes stop_codon:yes gene_type:complete